MTWERYHPVLSRLTRPPHGPPQSVSTTAANYPASYADNWVISVGASGNDGQHKTATNGNPNHPLFNDGYEASYGGGVDLIAPGTTDLVLTTRSRVGSWGSGLYTDFNGSSAAAPHVAGVAALMLSNQINPNRPQDNMAPDDVEQILQRTANDRVQASTSSSPSATAGYDDLTGWGLLDAGKAVASSRTRVFRFAHANVIGASTPATLIQTNIAVTLPNSYVSSGVLLNAGNYRADVWKVTTTVSARSASGPVTNPDEQIMGAWARNSSSVLWGSTNPIVTEPDVRVTSWDQNGATVEGYIYHIRARANLFGQAINQWIPTTLQNAVQTGVTFYTYNPKLEPNQASLRTTSGFLSVAYPNPATQEVNLTFQNSPTTGTVVVEILSSTGVRIHQKNFSATQILGERNVTLSVQELPTGLYSYRMITEQGVSVGKFTKQ